MAKKGITLERDFVGCGRLGGCPLIVGHSGPCVRTNQSRPRKGR